MIISIESLCCYDAVVSEFSLLALGCPLLGVLSWWFVHCDVDFKTSIGVDGFFPWQVSRRTSSTSLDRCEISS